MADIQKAREDFSKAQEFWSDAFSVTVNDFSAILSFGKRGRDQGDATLYEYQGRMPLSELKALALMALRLLREYEAKAGVTISLPPKLLEAFGIPIEDWQGGPRV